jgi:hypothetical protein
MDIKSKVRIIFIATSAFIVKGIVYVRSTAHKHFYAVPLKNITAGESYF